jgi:hypothetical protein
VICIESYCRKLKYNIFDCILSEAGAAIISAALSSSAAFVKAAADLSALNAPDHVPLAKSGGT